MELGETFSHLPVLEETSRGAALTFDAQSASQLAESLRKRDLAGRTIAIKVRLDDFSTITRARTIGEFTNDIGTVTSVALRLLAENPPPRPVRLLGVRVASFSDERAARPEAATASPSLLDAA